MSMTAKPAACFAPKALPPEPPMSMTAKPAACFAPKALPPAQPPALDLIVNRSRWVEPRHGGTRQPSADAMLARNDKAG
jgi:hypothetical protein